MKCSSIIDGERIEIELNRVDPPTIEAQIGGRKYLIDGKTVDPGMLEWKK